MKNFLRIIDRILTVIETVLVTVGMLAMVGLIFAEVVAARLGEHLPWASELAMYWLVGLTFVGASIAARGGEHIRIDVLVKLLGEKGARAANAVTAFLCVCFFIGAVKVGWDFADGARGFGERSPALGLPVWIVYMALPLAGLLLAVRFALVALAAEGTFDETGKTEGES
ncbi:MAG: TRAP transporter small permease subunit [bacterium]